MSWVSRGRAFAVAVPALLMFGVYASACAVEPTPGPTTGQPTPACAAVSYRSCAASFLGDFETGNFDQWPLCQNVAVGSVPCSLLGAPTYSMQVEDNVVRQGKFAARFELRHGDRPGCCGDRAEVSGHAATPAAATRAEEGDDLWYQWSTLFDDNFPAGQGWSVVSQWHAKADGSPPIALANPAGDRWGIVLRTWNAPGDEGPRFTPWSAPIIRGVWNDIKAHIKWSASDDVGFIEFWLNGAPQTFTDTPCAGQTRCMVRTLVPGGGGVYFKQGYYRDSSIGPTGVVYHDGFSVAHTEGSLAPL
jgi:Polysaccharide lyase